MQITNWCVLFSYLGKSQQQIHINALIFTFEFYIDFMCTVLKKWTNMCHFPFQIHQFSLPHGNKPAGSFLLCVRNLDFRRKQRLVILETCCCRWEQERPYYIASSWYIIRYIYSVFISRHRVAKNSPFSYAPELWMSLNYVK